MQEDLTTTTTPAGPRVTVRWESLTDETARAIARALTERVEGEVRFGVGDRAMYATDASNYRQVPIGIVVPKSLDDVIATLAVCREFGVPVISRGGGTSLAGQCCNVAVVMDFSKYLNTVTEIDVAKRLARVLPGTILDTLRDAAEEHHLTFGPDPATHTHCTLGGMIGNNSCGVHSVMAGRTSDNVEWLDVVTYDGCRLRVGSTTPAECAARIAKGGREGEIYAKLQAFVDRYADVIRARFPDLPRRISGYNLPALLPENGFNVAQALVGSEATLVTVLEAGLRLVESPPERSLVVLGYPDVYAAGDHILDVLAAKPIACEGLDECLITDERQMSLNVEDLPLLPEGKGWLLVEFGGDTPEAAEANARVLTDALKDKPDAPTIKVFGDRATQKKLWKIRESGLGATAWVPGHKITWPGWEDSAVPPKHVGAYLRDFRAKMDEYGYSGSLYGHFGDGCVHISIDFDLTTREGIDKYLAFISEMADIVVGYGGSLSGEHGDGQARAHLLGKMFGPEIVRAFREFKAIWDPEGRMNPGKVVDAYRPDENLRLGVDYRPAEPATHFAFPDDHYAFSDAALRCAGVGECRRLDGGTMCPSFKVTREEKHSTRGRARLLFEMLQGDPLKKGFGSEAVKDAMDLCLSCKGCKGDCPVQVDMATYKSEFLAHYFEGHRRPVTAFSMGLIRWWARLASIAPGAANAVTQAPGFSTAIKALGGIATERRMPRFAPETFRAWFGRHPVANPTGEAVILWVDTFNDHFHPDVAKDAVSVLEALGKRVAASPDGLCCGRPLYDYGFLDQAKALLRRILTDMRPALEAGTPVVGLEPSCVSVFRDELRNMFPHDEDARRLGAQVMTLAEYVEKYAADFEWPTLSEPVVYHGHCHHKAIMKTEADQRLLAKLGAELTVLDVGCCGMAGAFGFEKEHYEVAQAVGEHGYLPAIREAAPEAVIVADGFSCHEMAVQNTDREPQHLASVLARALREGGRLTPARERPRDRRPALLAAGVTILGLGVAVAARRAMVVGTREGGGHGHR